MNRQELIEASSAWDIHHKLPLIPIYNNPGFYCALMVKIAGMFPDSWKEAFEFFWKGSVTPNISRFPSGRGGNFSHDEIIGWAFLSKEACEFLLWKLEKWWGWFPNEYGKFEIGRFFYRFIFLKPYLLMRLGRPLPWHWEKLWCYHVSRSTKNTTKLNFDTSGINKIWIMGTHVGQYPECARVFSLWCAHMLDVKISPPDIYSVYLGDVPIVKQMAPESWV